MDHLITYGPEIHDLKKSYSTVRPICKDRVPGQRQGAKCMMWTKSLAEKEEMYIQTVL